MDIVKEDQIENIIVNVIDNITNIEETEIIRGEKGREQDESTKTSPDLWRIRTRGYTVPLTRRLEPRGRETRKALDAIRSNGGGWRKCSGCHIGSWKSWMGRAGTGERIHLAGVPRSHRSGLCKFRIGCNISGAVCQRVTRSYLCFGSEELRRWRFSRRCRVVFQILQEERLHSSMRQQTLHGERDRGGVARHLPALQRRAVGKFLGLQEDGDDEKETAKETKPSSVKDTKPSKVGKRPAGKFLEAAARKAAMKAKAQKVDSKKDKKGKDAEPGKELVSAETRESLRKIAARRKRNPQVSLWCP